MPLNVSDAQVNRGWVTSGLKRRELTNVSQILTRSGRNMKLSYVKEIVLISSAVWAQCTNIKDRQTMATCGTMGGIIYQWRRLKIIPNLQTRWYNKLTQTHFKRFVEDTKAPGTLSATSDDLDAELVFCVGSEVIDVNVQVWCVCHFLPPAGRASAARAATQLVPHRI